MTTQRVLFYAVWLIVALLIVGFLVQYALYQFRAAN